MLDAWTTKRLPTGHSSRRSAADCRTAHFNFGLRSVKFVARSELRASQRRRIHADFLRARSLRKITLNYISAYGKSATTATKRYRKFNIYDKFRIYDKLSCVCALLTHTYIYRWSQQVDAMQITHARTHTRAQINTLTISLRSRPIMRA